MQLNPQLKITLEALGASVEDEAIMLSFFQSQLASAQGQVDGFDNNIANLQRQRDIAQAQVENVSTMISKFTSPD